ncbi:O-antigen ligase family protein [Thalassotalea sp. Y01]|uniref:O-antigen ligase family protein n=1 Tax=Thalassotalea sp. Y01 TaxID=2729613 RepID=UPI00145EC0CD|nr:O-antigen ligase family protein [Thalassotalea sp. Y01]NMP16187.1 O-antigen ligase family protein [Thalassotalea sp. Y01]
MTFLILCLYFVFVIIRPHEWFKATEEWEVARYTVLVCAVAYVMFEDNKFWPKQLTLLLGVALAILLSMLFTGWVGGGVTRMGIFFFSSVIPVLLIGNIVKHQWQVEWVMRIMVLATCIMVYHGYVQMNSPLGIGWSGQGLIMDRATYIGVYSDPNDFGMYVLITLPMMFYLLGQSQSFFGKNYYRLAILASMYGIWISNSRGTLVGALVLAGYYFYRKFGMVKSSIVGVITFPAILWITGKFRTIDLDENSAQDRVLAWYDGFHMFLDNVLFGIGKGWFTDFHELTAHNSYILVMAELGLFGFVFWFGCLCFSMLQMSGVFADKVSKIQTTMFYSLLAFASTGFFLSRSFSNILYILLGLSAAVWWQKYHQDKESKPSTKKVKGDEQTFDIAEVQTKQMSMALVIAPIAVVFIYLVIKILLII